MLVCVSSLSPSLCVFLSPSLFLYISLSPSLPSLVTVNKFDFPSREFYSRNNVVHLLEFKAPLHIISFVFAASLQGEGLTEIVKQEARAIKGFS